MRNGGFTLLEMLVAISVLGLLSMSVASGLHLGSDSFSRARMQAAAGERSRHGQRVLKSLVTGAYPAFVSADLEDRRIAFAGDAEGMALVTRLPQALGSPAMVAGRLHVDDGELVLDWRLDLPAADGEGTAPENRTVIATAVSHIALAYFGAAAPGAAPGWQAVWTGRTALPSLVRVAVEHDGRWSELVAAPLATGNTACFYDPSDVECRRIH